MLASSLRPRHLFVAPLSLLIALTACTQPSPPGSEENGDVADGTAGDDEAEDTTGDSSDTTGDSTETADTSTETADTSTETADTSTETEGETTGNVAADTLYPLVDGATWTYLRKTTQGQVLSMEEVEMTEIDYQGETAWLQVDSPNANGNWTESVLIRDGDLVLRIHKEENSAMGITALVDYDAGFVRTNDQWDAVDFFEEFMYVRTETDAMGLNPDVEDRGHAYKVNAIHQSVTVPAGTFDDCIEIERIRTVGTNIGEKVIFWYALGVGKVREERPLDSRIEELAAVNIPGGASYP